MSTIERRLLPARPDLAAARLRGLVEADRFVEPRPMRVASYCAPVRRAPRRDAALDTEALHGEDVDVFEIDDEGWAWGQLLTDGYVGYLPADDLTARAAWPTHAVQAPRTFVYPAPDMKRPPLGALPLAARIHVSEPAAGGPYLSAEGGFVFAAHLRPLDAVVGDYAAVAEHLRGTPYLWGGRTSSGLDCSALVQLCLSSAGRTCPRDSDLQAASLGRPLEATGERAGLVRGDLVFWKGHVGMMLDAERLIHANGFHMMVEIEPLDDAVRRIEASGGGGITHLKAMA
ncbi:C40 family peptidase [Chelatococcus reniformis]|uniref:Peptidase P60 n=1 Tax=Chelatococcus reniformis TaxID=1494448 RepID=A0A916UXU2_9HYPH|nr:NlpC/P60 family protein [Chelatococcus reniformis]GGC93683.1 peptidase P60 [Chelatococcus reniformis]